MGYFSTVTDTLPLHQRQKHTHQVISNRNITHRRLSLRLNPVFPVPMQLLCDVNDLPV